MTANNDNPEPGVVQALSADPEQSATLPAHYYYDPDIFDREKHEIFFKSWQFAGYMEDLAEPGSYITCQIFDQNLAVVRGRDGRLRAFHNVCQHRGHEVMTGKGRARMLMCPYHAWTYDLEGKLKTVGNAENVAGFELGDYCLTEIAVEAFGIFAFVHLDRDAEPLASIAGDLLEEFRTVVPGFDDLKHFRRLPFEVRANWKITVDNYVECYHCPVVHRGMASSDSSTQPSFEIEDRPAWSRHIIRSDSDICFGYEIGKDDPIRDVYLWALWPNTMYMVRPGASNMGVFQIIPTGPEACVEILDDLAPTIPPRETELRMFDNFRNITNPQDIGVCEGVQRGMKSRAFTRGRLMVDRDRSWRSEHSVHHFERAVWTALNGPAA